MPEIEGLEGVPAGRGDHALVIGQLLLTLVRSRRFYFEEFLEGDGPYWTVIGLFVDAQIGTASTLDRVATFADESMETSRYILRLLIESSKVEDYSTRDGERAVRLTPLFEQRLRRFLTDQGVYVSDAAARLV